MTSHAIKGSDIFIRVLENEGVEYIFGVPAEENLDMLESLKRTMIALLCFVLTVLVSPRLQPFR
jgi:thiamine pyrophosphate-dependent acetolactate synthase large subunit-like protein